MQVDYQYLSPEFMYELFLDEHIKCGCFDTEDKTKFNIEMTCEEFYKVAFPPTRLTWLFGDDDSPDYGDFEIFGEMTKEWWSQWKRGHTLYEICESAGKHYRVPVLKPVTILGQSCMTAGAFLTLKQMLADDGADVTQLAPSTPISKYLYQRPDIFRRFAWSRPKQFPEIVEPFNKWSIIAQSVFVLGLSAHLYYTWHLHFCLAMPVAIMFLFLAVRIICMAFKVPSFQFQGVVTFRELIKPAFAKAVAN